MLGCGLHQGVAATKQGRFKAALLPTSGLPVEVGVLSDGIECSPPSATHSRNVHSDATLEQSGQHLALILSTGCPLVLGQRHHSIQQSFPVFGQQLTLGQSLVEVEALCLGTEGQAQDVCRLAGPVHQGLGVPE